MIETAHRAADDPSGLLILERFADAGHFNQWLFDTISPFCEGQVLEVGSGIGNITRLFLDKNFHITASDLRLEYKEVLDQQFQEHPCYGGSFLLDLEHPEIDNRYWGSFDTVIASNVVEHVAHPETAINTCIRLLKPKGKLVILVPAYQSLYNNFDKELGHYTRYTAKTLKALLEKETSLAVTHTRYFNAMGILGWWFNGAVLGKKLIPENQLKWYNKAVPLFRLLDRITFHRVGLSVIAAAHKKN